MALTVLLALVTDRSPKMNFEKSDGRVLHP
jgi:hypothetical protein